MKPIAGLIFALCILFTPISVLHAQGEAALPFLLTPASPEGNGMGGIAGTTITESPLATLANPGQLGLMSLDQYIAAGFYPTSTNWLPALGDPDLTYSATVISAGINLDKIAPLPFGLSIGVAHSHVDLNLGYFTVPSVDPYVTQTIDAKECTDNWTLGIGIDYYIRLGFGYTNKGIQSNLVPFDIQSQGRQGVASTAAYDIGIMLDIPVTNIITQFAATPLTVYKKTQALFDISLGSAWSNMGDHFVTYIDAAQADPLPRNAMLGISYKAGLVIPTSTTSWEVISFTLAHQAEDVLVQRFATPADSNGFPIGNPLRPQYESGMGAIQFFNNVILGEGNTRITLRKGWQINLGELVYISGGSIRGGGQLYTTDGWGLRLSGLLKLIAEMRPAFSESRIPMFILNHFDIRYDHASSTYDDPNNPNDGVTYNSISVILK
jgi:hypothetical protein